MIELINVKKTFYDKAVLDNLSLRIPNATIFGLMGADGSGKSTVLRIIAGIYHADGGFVKIDGQAVYENPLMKQQIRLVSDDPFFLNQATIADMRKFYLIFYPDFNDKTYRQMLELFQLNEKKKINRFSSGAKKQAALALALACNCKYLLLDEVFDGLESGQQAGLIAVLKDNVENFGQTTIITSDNLSELTDICDSLGLIKDGHMKLSGSAAELSTDISKFQLSFSTEKTPADFAKFSLLAFEKNGHVITLIVRGERKKIIKQLNSLEPIFIDELPLNLKDSFLFEMEAQTHGTP